MAGCQNRDVRICRNPFVTAFTEFRRESEGLARRPGMNVTSETHGDQTITRTWTQDRQFVHSEYRQAGNDYVTFAYSRIMTIDYRQYWVQVGAKRSESSQAILPDSQYARLIDPTTGAILAFSTDHYCKGVNPRMTAKHSEVEAAGRLKEGLEQFLAGRGVKDYELVISLHR